MAAVGFGTIVNVLGQRTKPYLPQICGILLWRLNNKSAKGMADSRSWNLELHPLGDGYH